MASQPHPSPGLTATRYQDVLIGARYYHDATGLNAYVKNSGSYPPPDARVYIEPGIPNQQDLIERPPLALAIRGRISGVVCHLEAEPGRYILKHDVLLMLQGVVRDIDRHLGSV